MAHVGEHSQNESSSIDEQEKQQSGFSQFYLEYRAGTIWVIVEVLIVLGATGLAVRHYFQKSGSSSLKEFIRERIL